MTESKAPRKRQMKFLGGVWELRGKYSVGLKHRFKVAELRWMLEKAEADGVDKLELITEPRRKKGGPHSPTHTAICYVFEGEWGWDPDMPVKEVGGEKTEAEKAKDDPFA